MRIDNPEIFHNLCEEHEVRHLFEKSGFKDVELHPHADDSDEFYVVTGRK